MRKPKVTIYWMSEIAESGAIHMFLENHKWFSKRIVIIDEIACAVDAQLFEHSDISVGGTNLRVPWDNFSKLRGPLRVQVIESQL